MKVLDRLSIRPGEVVYDLGCGNAAFLVEAARKGAAKCVGYEIAPIAYCAAVANTFFKKGIFVRMENFLRADIEKADVVYIYLIPRAIAPLREKFEKELRPGARFACVGSPMPDWKPELEITLKGDYKAYIYRK